MFQLFVPKSTNFHQIHKFQPKQMMSFFKQNNDRAPSRRTSTPANLQSTYSQNPSNNYQQNSYQYANTNNNAYNNGTVAPSANYKLYYFPVRNTAEASRMILAYSGVPFEDIRISANEWPKWKASKCPEVNKSQTLYLSILVAFWIQKKL
jgi:hypothetical protein